MIKASVRINCPIDIVWNYFLTPSNWEKWWGGKIKKVVPRWQENCEIEWGSGEVSRIIVFSPKNVVVISGAWMDTTYNFQAVGNTETIVEIIEKPKRGAYFTDGGLAERIRLESSLQKLKMLIEEESTEIRIFESIKDVFKKLWNKIFQNKGSFRHEYLELFKKNF
ncbi:MAG: hypothetical protein ABIM20_07250 [candidate division WOR-3 bacterium]